MSRISLVEVLITKSYSSGILRQTLTATLCSIKFGLIMTRNSTPTTLSFMIQAGLQRVSSAIPQNAAGQLRLHLAQNGTGKSGQGMLLISCNPDGLQLTISKTQPLLAVTLSLMNHLRGILVMMRRGYGMKQ